MSSSASNTYSIKNELITSWNGAYKDASIQRFRRLDTQCGICFTDFLPNDLITILPCSHGWHKRCITQWTGVSKTCPADRFSTKATHTLSFSGHSFELPPFTSKIFSRHDVKNIIKAINNYLSNQPSLVATQQEKELLDSLLIPLLQGLIDAEKTISTFEVHIEAEELFANLFDFLEQNNIDLFDLFKRFGCYDEIIELFYPINDYLQGFLPPFCMQLNRGKIYLEAAFRLPGFNNLWLDFRKRVYYKQLGAIRKLSTKTEKLNYLQNLSPFTLLLVREESADHPNGPTTKFIDEELPEWYLLENS